VPGARAVGAGRSARVWSQRMFVEADPRVENSRHMRRSDAPRGSRQMSADVWARERWALPMSRCGPLLSRPFTRLDQILKGQDDVEAPPWVHSPDSGHEQISCAYVPLEDRSWRRDTHE
jgi:hypothetical protein